MGLIAVVAVVVVALVVMVILVQRATRERSSTAGAGDVFSLWESILQTFGARIELPYRKVDALLTPAERSFYEVLRQVADTQDLHVFPKVRLSDVVFVPRRTDNWQSHQNRIQQKHLDFVLCDRRDVSPVLAVELDDSSHRRSDRQERDDLVDEILGAACLPILRVAVRQAYSWSELGEKINNCLGVGRNDGSGDEPAEAIVDDRVEDAIPVVVGASAMGGAAVAAVQTQLCPRCGSDLVERSSRQTGKKFWGCRSYPSCRYTRAW